MAEYIEREAALMNIMQDGCSASNIAVLMSVPAADVAPVRHGYWKEIVIHNGCTFDYDCVCSVCNESGAPYYNYCQSCGAKMDLGGDDNGCCE